jgi:hypothetical protein
MTAERRRTEKKKAGTADLQLRNSLEIALVARREMIDDVVREVLDSGVQEPLGFAYIYFPARPNKVFIDTFKRIGTLVCADPTGNARVDELQRTLAERRSEYILKLPELDGEISIKKDSYRKKWMLHFLDRGNTWSQCANYMPVQIAAARMVIHVLAEGGWLGEAEIETRLD